MQTHTSRTYATSISRRRRPEQQEQQEEKEEKDGAAASLLAYSSPLPLAPTADLATATRVSTYIPTQRPHTL